jgi:hypothetical protein
LQTWSLKAPMPIERRATTVARQLMSRLFDDVEKERQ